MDKKYNFQILLPNGTTVRLKFQNPEMKMPFRDFIERVEKEYDRSWKKSGSLKRKREINWKGGSFLLVDSDDVKIENVVNFKNFKPQECHILRLQDGHEDSITTFENMWENMWDLTPDTDLLKELPQEYTFETALADLIDNSLQAVWSNDTGHDRHISVVADEDMISIFDNGPGMDASNENCIVKWGKMGASLHRSYKEQAIGGKPPYLKPFFGMFGYGGPIASMQLGRRALVSSKTKDSKKVYTLNLDRDALLSGSWKTGGSMRDPEEDEISRTQHRSFTKVEIFEPKSNVDTDQLRWKLKDIYFPYIQYDEDSQSGKTIMPVKFEVNGVDLAEIDGGEIAITNMHSCRGPDFVLQLQFSFKQDSKTYCKANARLKCVYFPIEQGKENIDKVVERLGARENFETFSRVSIRRLGRLLPDARWGLLPFMDLKQKRGTTAQLLKKCCMRVKCFIETDAGFNPTSSKTDLAHGSPFTNALRNFGNKPLENENVMKVEMYKDGKLISPSQLKKEYKDWIIEMHNRYDHDEADCGEDEPVFVVSPANKKALRISSEVARVHKSLTRNGRTWKSGQKLKILKGACVGVQSNKVYATIEYFLLEGLQDESGGEARILCRPSSLPDEKGSILSVNNGNTNLEMGESLSIPLSVIDAGKCIAVGRTEWEDHIERRRQKSPSTIEILDVEQCQELEIDGALPVDTRAGKVPPEEIVAVVRPGNYVYSSSSKSLDQKYVVKSNLEMSMEVTFKSDAKGRQNVHHIYSVRVGAKSLKGIEGVYVFTVKHKLKGIFQRAGIYAFSFHLNESGCKSAEKRVRVKPSSKVGKWVLLNNDQPPLYQVRVGSAFPPLSIACYDVYDNQIPFATTLEVAVKVQTNEDLLFHVGSFTKEFSNHTLTVKDMLMESSELDKLRPTYEATLVVCSEDEKFSVSVPCKVIPGPLQTVKAIPPIFENQVLPGYTIQELVLEMFDQYGNHVIEGTEVQLNVEGVSIQDRRGSTHKADHHGCIDLGGLLKVSAGYEKNVSISVYSNNNVLLKLQSHSGEDQLVLPIGRMLLSISMYSNNDVLLKLQSHSSEDQLVCHEGIESGTIAGAFKYEKGLVGFADSRGTIDCGHVKRYSDGRDKYHLISEKSKLFFIRCGTASESIKLARSLNFEVRFKERLEDNTGATVSLEEAVNIAQMYLAAFVKKNPENCTWFGGILFGIGPTKKYGACRVGVVERHVRTPNYLSTFLICGSGAKHALTKLQNLVVDRQVLSEPSSVDLVKDTALQTYLETATCGGRTNVFFFRDGYNPNGVPDLKLDPLPVHAERHWQECDRIILLLVHKTVAPLDDSLEQVFRSWLEVLCVSRVVDKSMHWLYRVLCRSTESAIQAFDKMIQMPASQKKRDISIHPSFSFIRFNIGDMTKVGYAAPCSETLLQFLNDSAW